MGKGWPLPTATAVREGNPPPAGSGRVGVIRRPRRRRIPHAGYSVDRHGGPRRLLIPELPAADSDRLRFDLHRMAELSGMMPAEAPSSRDPTTPEPVGFHFDLDHFDHSHIPSAIPLIPRRSRGAH